MIEEYPSLHIEGSLISAEVLADIREEKTPGQRGSDFSGEKDQKLLDLVSAAWGDAQERYILFQKQVGRLSESDLGTTQTRAWISDFLTLLGFDLVRLQHLIEQYNKKYHISHRAGMDPNAPPVHIVGFRQSIDRRPESGPSLMAPHSMLQDFLNNSEELWGIVTNGLVLRLLRDSHLMKRQAYIEFDLEEIFTGDRFPDFYLLFRLVHVTRFPKGISDTESCFLEQYHRLSIEQGGRVRDGLRNGVERALLLLANGFLSHPENTGFAADVAAGKIDPTDLYRQLLKIVYRLLFLMVCEERGLISSDPVYKQQYSINRLRKLIQHRGAYSHHTDLWTGLVTQFRLFSDEELGKVIGVPPLNGELFADHGTALVNDLCITNDSLLNAIWNLGMYQEEIKQGRRKVYGPWRRVNYGALDVEELGSVYESLLDLQPGFLPTVSGNTAFQFFAGTERKSTGSYYTPPELVNELIQSALVPVIDDRLSGLMKKEEKENALLSISVCDPACGSGHFLLAAARRIGRELAKVRSGDEEPSPEANRDAIRDVITHCIYGVDKNPLAVDLCRVALWLEGHTAGKPLTFLDHRIRCGDSLVGVHDLNILKKGIPPEAYKALTGDDKDVAKKYVALAKDHLKSAPSSSEQEKKKLEKRAKGSALVNQPLFDASDLSQSEGEFSPQQDLVHLVAERRDLAVEDRDIKTVRCKAERFEQSRKPGTVYDHDVRACNIWTSAFFAELTRDNEAAGKIPTNVTLQSALSRKSGEITKSQAPIQYAQELAEMNRFFHWPIEFPEIMSNGGFDCIIGNPPFLGGIKLKGSYSLKYLNFVEVKFTPFHGIVDICAAFLRQYYYCLKLSGLMGIIGTNTLGQGDTRKAGLKVIIENNGILTCVDRYHFWKSDAVVEVCLLTIGKFRKNLKPILDGVEVDYISSRLDEDIEDEPRRITVNLNKAYIGDYVRGLGFIIDKELAQRLLKENPNNCDCLFEYLNGEDINNSYDLSSDRYVICFHDWTVEHAKQYPDLFNILKPRC